MGVPQTVGAYPMNASHRRMALNEPPNGMLGKRVTAPRQDEIGRDVAPLHIAPASKILQRERIERYNALARLGLWRVIFQSRELR